MKRLLLSPFFLLAIISCNSSPEASKEKENTSNLVWSENIQSILPMEKDSVLGCSDLSNVNSSYDKKAVFNSITEAVLSGKLKAYENYPDKELNLDQIKSCLTIWDSSAQVEDEKNPGTFISKPTLNNITHEELAKIVLHESVEFDTTRFLIQQKVSFLSLYAYGPFGENGIEGYKKVFDVKLNGTEPHAKNK